MKKKTKKMHFIPQFYLRYFSDQYGLIHVLDVKTKEIISKRPKKLFYRDYYYSKNMGIPDDFGQEIEENFSKGESVSKQILSEFIEDIKSGKINQKQKSKVSSVIAFLDSRTDALRIEGSSAFSEVSAKIKDMMRESDPNAQHVMFNGKKVYLNDLKEGLDLYKHGPSHMSMFQGAFEAFFSTLPKKPWRVYVSKNEEYGFFTYDNLLVDVPNPNPIPENGSWDPKKNHILKRRQFFTVCPTILIEFLPVSRWRRKIKITHLGKRGVRKINREIASLHKDYQKIISNRKEKLEEIKLLL